ncbi:unnamed protein product [Mytilus edulis]|uniref:B box-type domain-containing protein n=1 Tax=Mytilus edulis TaxID=6550 RepID=A0A8S3Q2J6_MYTED|nr:unnamed protein product [Mytilus edulis]
MKHIVVKERDTTNVSSSQWVKEIEKNVTSKDTTEWISTGHTKTVNTEFEDYLVTQCRKSQFEDPAIFPNASSLEITFSHDSGSSFAELKKENMASTSRYFCTAQFTYHDGGSSPEAVTWCTECEEFLCTDCEKYHTILKINRFHKTISTKEYHNLQTFMREIHVSSQCRDHKGNMNFTVLFMTVSVVTYASPINT